MKNGALRHIFALSLTIRYSRRASLFHKSPFRRQRLEGATSNYSEAQNVLLLRGLQPLVSHLERVPCVYQCLHNVPGCAPSPVLLDELIGVRVAAEHLYSLSVVYGFGSVLHSPHDGVVPIHRASSRR